MPAQFLAIIGPPAKRHLNDVSLEGQWRLAFRCGSVVVESLYNVPHIDLVEFCVWSLFCYASRSIASSFEVLEGIYWPNILRDRGYFCENTKYF